MSSPTLDLRRAVITIGGQLTRITRERLVDALVKDGLGPHHRVYFTSVQEIEDAIDVAIKTKRPIVLMDHRAKNGRFEATEAACRQYKLVFRRHSYARARHEGEIHFFNGADAVVVPATQNGQPYIALDQIVAASKTSTGMKPLVERLMASQKAIPALSAL